MSEESYDVFISHAGEDKETIAIPLSEKLQSYGISVFLDTEKLRFGEYAPAHMIGAMETAYIGVFILSPEFAAKRWPMRELYCFLERYAQADKNGGPQPLLIPIFYRLGLDECHDTSLFAKGRDGDIENFFVEFGFFERAAKGETSVQAVMNALKSISKHRGFENDEGATNEQSAEMAGRREQILNKACAKIVRAVNQSFRNGKFDGKIINEKPLRNPSERNGEKDRVRSCPPETSYCSRKYKIALFITLLSLALISRLSRTLPDVEGKKSRQKLCGSEVQNSNDPNELNSFALRLVRGDSNVHGDPHRAIACFEEAISKGQNVEAMVNLGRVFEDGAPGVQPNHEKAAELYERAILEGASTDAMYRLGDLLWNKGSLKTDTARAVDLYERAIREGQNDAAVMSLAKLFLHGAAGVDPDPQRAVALYEQEIAQNSEDGDRVAATNNLAEILADGMRTVKQDPVRAVALYERAIHASKTKFARSALKCSLGVLFEKGAPGLEPDSGKAISLFQGAIEEDGNADAKQRLGRLLLDGAQGVKQDPGRRLGSRTRGNREAQTFPQRPEHDSNIETDARKEERVPGEDSKSRDQGDAVLGNERNSDREEQKPNCRDDECRDVSDNSLEVKGQDRERIGKDRVALDKGVDGDRRAMGLQWATWCVWLCVVFIPFFCMCTNNR